MLRLTEIRLPLDHMPGDLTQTAAERLNLPVEDILSQQIVRRGYDARKRGRITLVYTLDLEVRDEAAVLERMADSPHVRPSPDTHYQCVNIDSGSLVERPDFKRPVVVGAGPCGLLAGLILAQLGLRPIIIERGKSVRERTVDTFALWRRGVLTPESNVQFGEGGAGTFSDGKLYSQISDPRHLGRKVLEEFVRAGAPEEILYVSKPHIGTFRLVSMVEHIRDEIITRGGEYRFNTRVEKLITETAPDGQQKISGLRLSDGSTLQANHVILAIGHSARDTFSTLQDTGVVMEAKPFSMGVRIEHPQSLIDEARFGSQAGSRLLGAADYKLVHHASNGRGVYSFCMCPGGTVVAATSESGSVVTNGMSQYSRAERNANAGIVVELKPGIDYPNTPLAGVAWQQYWEKKAFEVGGGNYHAPAQRVGDFLAGRPSTTLGTVTPSYKPGVTPTDLSLCLPEFVTSALREALPAFAGKLNAFALEDAVMTGIETRTSSPLRIRRGDDGQSINIRGLFPAGEGAGYAGGILSAAVDGIRIAEAVAHDMAGQTVHGLIRGDREGVYG